MTEHYTKQKNSRGGRKSETPTLKIKNITFCRQYTKSIDQQLLNFHLRMGRNMSHKYFDCNKKNKENAYQYINSAHTQDKKVGITDIFSIKSVNLTNSSKLFFPLKLFGDSTNLKINEVFQGCSNQSRNFLKRKSETNEGRKQQKSKTALDQFKRQSSCQLLNRKSRAKTQKNNQRNILREKRLILNTNDKIFQTKYQNYCQFLQQVADLHSLKINFEDYQKSPVFIVGKGNNSKLVKDTLKKRWWLKIEQKKANEAFNLNEINLIWSQIKVNQFYESISQNKNLHNHFQFNGNLGNKKELFLNMKQFYLKQNKNPFQVLPLTFHVKNTQDHQYLEFKSHFKIQKLKSNSKGIWIVKPGQNSNRGRGITIHTQLEEIERLISQESLNNKSIQKSQSHTFIIQKYIQKPFLYQKRKFDIRCYYLLVCINDKVKGYWYKQGYIRTSSFQFTCNSQNNFYVHLTNDAVQKNSEDYGKFEDGNKIDYNSFRKYIASKNLTKKFDFDTQIYQKMKQMALDSIKSTYKKLRKSKKAIFEIFGLDFMIDQEFKPWLIQVNTNPCLQTSCLVLERIIPKMLDDALQLSVDVIFPPPKTWPSSRKHLVPNHQFSGFELIFDQSFEEVSQTKQQN